MTPGARGPAIAVVLAGVLLAGCASLDRVRPEHGGPLLWTLNGRLALSDGRDGGSGEFVWHQGENWAELEFVGALGRGHWRLEVQSGRATLELANGEVYRAVSVPALLAEHFDWELPVDELRHWVQAQPAPGDEFSAERDAQGRLVRLEQSGWRVEFDGYGRVEASDGPRRITARRGDERVRLLIRSWQPGAT